MKRPPIIRIFALQVALSMAVSAVFFLWKGYVAAYSSLLGGMIFCIPQLYFGFKAFLVMGARSNHMIVQNFYKGESTKLILIAVGFALAFKFVQPLDHLAIFSTFICIVVFNALMPLFTNDDT